MDSKEPPAPVPECAVNPTIPEASSSFLSKWTYGWLNPLLRIGKAHPLSQSDLYTLDPLFSASHLSTQFEAAWAVEMDKKPADNSSDAFRLFRALFRAFGAEYLQAAVFMFLYVTLQIVTSVVMLYLIQWIQRGDQQTEGLWYGYVLGVVLFVTQLGATVSYNRHLEMTTKLGFRLRTSLISAVYKKAFVVSNEARNAFTVGKIINLTATDTNRIDLSCQMNHYIWAGPFQFVVALSLLVWLLGPSALVGVAIIAVYIPFQYRIVGVLSGFRRSANKFMDKRVKLIQEVLLGIRVVKMYAWEESFQALISDARAEEMKQVRGFLFSRAIVNGISQTVPTIAMMCSFVCFTLVGNQLTPAVVFAALQLFYTIRNPFMFLPNIVTQGVDAWFGLARIGEYLLAAELKNEAKKLPENDQQTEKLAIKIEDGHFSWHRSSIDPSAPSEATGFELTDINLQIPQGKLVAIVGRVGSGKSSLLNGLVNEMTRIGGSVSFRGSVSYCPQSPFIQNATIKENILFGKEWNEQRYDAVTRASCLERDFAILPNGDDTEIGERGVNLSGGQKARVQIARALYFESDIVLLDDPLSAVDAHVGRRLFEDAILNGLAAKTRVLVTHQLHFLPQVDSIILMDSGKIVAQGTFEALIQNNEAFATMMNEFKVLNVSKESEEKGSQGVETKEGDAVAEKQTTGPTDHPADSKPKGLIVAEERNIGAVQLKYYLKYLALCGGVFAATCLTLAIVFHQASRVMTDQWLAYWTNRSLQLSNTQYIGIYVGLCLLLGCANVTYGLTVSYFGTRASMNMHNEALASVLKSPISFFDATPLGRLTSRFSRDVDAIDNQLPIFMYQVCQTFGLALANFILISINIPAFLAPLAVMLAGYYWLQVYYRTTALELKRLDSISRSPLLANVSETINGLATIRAYAAKERFITKNYALLDTNNQAYYLSQLIQRWIQLRVEGLNAFLVLITSIFVIVFRWQLNPGLAGLVLVYITQSSTALSNLVSMSANLEINMNSAERIIHYIDELESEQTSELFLVANKEQVKTDSTWPADGKVDVQDLVLRYRPDLPPVLHDVSFTIEAGSKVGIVGRTGAGKSSILTCLLRLFEPEAGSIVIDGVNVQSIGLKELRRKIGVIPQEPVLFSGTIRTNLDPFQEYSDAELWNAIERAGLKETVSAGTDGLDSVVTENGSNWSTGQRQLICLARAVLKNAKIILLDEATASVDLSTDEFIQKAVRSNFSTSTVLTIAHRLNTVADYDKIMVLEAGRVVEFGNPFVLLGQEDGFFSRMVAETGPQNAAIIRDLSRAQAPRV
ncbi:hypothetical protein HDU80_000172 [Chytriomyces hyalinus]|nr:hypothetical protein HDU80_000172 [Chytriomyces hyalinus]